MPSMAWRRSSPRPTPKATTMCTPAARSSVSMICRIGV
jgi:hypothetical protein